MLDEPTNHLDTDATAWFEDFLSEYRGRSCLFRTTDIFLTAYAQAIFEVENKHLTCYDGNFTAYREKETI